MTTIAVGNLKGGVGTTTLAVNLAALLQRAGHDVSLVDCGGAGDIYRWVERRHRHGLGNIRCRTWSQAGATNGDDSSYTIIDAGSDRRTVLPLLANVDFWLAPTPPDFPDYMSTLNLFNSWREARAEQDRPGLFAGAITQVRSDERELEWTARRKLSFARQDMIVLNQSLTRHAAWDATYGGYAMHELPANVAGKATGEFGAMVGQLLAYALLTLAAPVRLCHTPNGRQATVALL